jgi:hypothetical protein
MPRQGRAAETRPYGKLATLNPEIGSPLSRTALHSDNHAPVAGHTKASGCLERDQMVKTGLLSFVIFAFAVSAATCQTAGPLSDSILGSTNEAYKRHYAPTGKPCLTLAGSAKPQVVNKDMIDHWVTVLNECAQRIKVQVCYFHTESCITVEAPPYGRKDGLLGVYPKLRDFRYDYKEQF